MFTRRQFISYTALSAALLAAGCDETRKFKVYIGPQITLIEVYKKLKIIDLYIGDDLVKRYKMELGFTPRGHKQIEGDGKTPEGRYYIDRKNPKSRFHLSLGISYPNEEDIKTAKALGKSPGGDIFIHGTPSLYFGEDNWTWGCIAVTNEEIEEIYSMVKIGTPIVIYP